MIIFYEQVCDDKFDNLKKMDKCLKRHKTNTCSRRNR